MLELGPTMRWLAAVVLSLSAVTAALAAPPLPGSNQRQVRDEAVRSIPLSQLKPEHRERVQQIVDDTTLFRRLPTQAITCDPKFYLFMVDHPEVVVGVWRALGLSEIKLQRTGEATFRADDGAGTTGSLEFIHRSPDTHVMLADGSYEGALLPKPVRGHCVLILKTSYSREADGRSYITCRLDSFMQLENITFDVLAKTFQPLVGQMADHNFRETIAFVGGLNQAAEANPDGMQRVADKMHDISPDVRKEFTALSEQVAVEAALIRTANGSRNGTRGSTTARPIRR